MNATYQSTKQIQHQLAQYQDDYGIDGLTYATCWWHNDTPGGLIITEDNEIRAGFTSDYAASIAGWSVINPGWEDCQRAYVCDKPIISVLRAGRPYIVDRKTGEWGGRLGKAPYDSDRQRVKTRYAIAVLGRDKDGYALMCTEPFVLSLKGTVGVAFGNRKNGILPRFSEAVSRHIGQKAPRWAFALHMQCREETVGQDRDTSTVQMPYGYEGVLRNDENILNRCYIGEANLPLLKKMWEDTEGFDEHEESQASPAAPEATAPAAAPPPSPRKAAPPAQASWRASQDEWGGAMPDTTEEEQYVTDGYVTGDEDDIPF